MRPPLLFALATAAVLLGGSTLEARQTPECLDAYETLTHVKERVFAGGLTPTELTALHHNIRARTRDCEDLAELWQMRGRLAELVGDAADLAVVKARGSRFYRAEPVVRRGAFDPSTPIGKRWALLAGTGTFAHKDELRVTDLEYAEADVRLLARLFEERLGFTHVEPLLGPQFTLDGWRAAVAALREQVEDNDLVVIYLVSHGMPTREDRNNTSFILTHASRGANAAQVYTTSIQVIDVVQELARELKAQRVVILLDACYSGDAISGQRDYAGHPAPYLLEAFTRGSHRAVIAAARADQRSWELPDRRQGAFAYCLDRIAAPSVTLGETFAALGRCVGEEVGALKQAQDPQLFASEGARSIVLGGGP